MTDSQAHWRVLNEVADERGRQDARWGEQNHSDGTGRSGMGELARLQKDINVVRVEEGELTWFDILYEEVLEAFAETDPSQLRAELVQVAAVATAWIESMDRRGA